MLSSLFLLLLFGLLVAAVAAAARGIGRSIPLPVLAAIALLPVAFLFPCFFAWRTPAPVDHAMAIPPWSALGPVTRYNPNLDDSATQMLPWAKAVRMAWKERSLPLRDRWNGCGMALAANAQSEAFSPLTFLMMLLPLARAETLAVAVKLLLALAGMWLWLVELGVSDEGALFGAVSFGLSGTMTPWLLFPHTSVLCLWPWALLFIELLQNEHRVRRGFWGLTLVLLLWQLAGHPESVALAGFFIGIWILTRWGSGGLRNAQALLGRLLLAAASAIGLSAFLLIPELAAIRASNRLETAGQFWNGVALRWLAHGPLWWTMLFTPFFPRTFGDAIKSPMVDGRAGSYSEMALAYFGIAGWALVLAILRRGSQRKSQEMSLVAPLLIGFSVSIALWPAFEMVRLVPVLRLLPPLRFFSWIALAGSAIAAFELDRLRKDLAGRPVRVSWSFLVILLSLAALGFLSYWRFHPSHVASGGVASQRNALALALLALAGAGAVVWLAALKPKAIPLVPVLLLAVSGAELFDQGRRLYRFGNPAELFPPTPLVKFLQSRPAPFRVLGEDAMFFPNTNVFAGVEEVRTHDPVERRDYVEFLDSAAGYTSDGYFKNFRNVNAPVLDLLNVRYLVSSPDRSAPGEKWTPVYRGGDGSVFENASVFPRVFAPDGPPEAHRQNGRVALTDYSEKTNAASFRARVLPGGGDVLVLASLVQDGGWSAVGETGAEIPTERAWGPFLGLRLGSGDHVVRLRYCPPGFRLGGAISVATAAALAAAEILRRRRRGASLEAGVESR